MNNGERILKIKQEDFKNNFLKSLLEIPDCPKEIYIQGKLFKREDFKFLTIIGSRNHSQYAKEALEKIISELSGYNIIIISGLALGIDTWAHKLALKYNLKTIAVPGSGISTESLYPKSNFSLAQDILNNEGVLLSEFEPNFKATPWSFPQRNRVMAGLADLVLVVEAGEKSGTIITAKLALDYNREVAVIPNSIFSNFSAGSNKLLKTGAQPIFSGKDILELLNLEFSDSPQQMEIDFSDLSEKEILILKFLQEPKSKKEIQEKTEMSISELNTLLSILEIKNLIIERMGKFRKR